VFPKGALDDNDASPKHAAEREAMEEAGVVGEVLDCFDFRAQYRSRRVKKKGIHPNGLCEAQCFVMTVTEELDTWPEDDRRERQWYPIGEAIARCKHGWQQDALCELEERLPELASSLDGLGMWNKTGSRVEVRKDADTCTTVYHFA